MIGVLGNHELQKPRRRRVDTRGLPVAGFYRGFYRGNVIDSKTKLAFPTSRLPPLNNLRSFPPSLPLPHL